VFSVSGKFAQDVTLLTCIQKYLVAIPVGAQTFLPDFFVGFFDFPRECRDITLK
jgi:hypothetical protein